MSPDVAGPPEDAPDRPGGAAVAAALAGSPMAGVPAASAGTGETVIVTATGLLSPAAAVLGMGGTLLAQFHLINGVEAVGRGVTVAVLDTGIDNLPDFSGRLIGGVDLTGANNPFQDSYGHGTFVAPSSPRGMTRWSSRWGRSMTWPGRRSPRTRPVVVYREGESEAFNMDEAFFVILALLVPPLVTLGTLALATVTAQAVRRRPLVRSAFNAGQVVTAAGLGIAVSRGVAAPAASPSLAQVAAVVLGVAVYCVANTLLVVGVLASMGTSWRELTGDLPIQVALAGAGALAGVVLALAIQAHPLVLGLAVPGLVMQRRLISARFAALYDHTRMKGLYEVTLKANRGLRHQAVLDTILESVRRLLRSPEATLTAEPPGHGQLAAPMMVGDQQLWLAAAGRRRDEPFDDADRGLLQALAAVGRGALSNAGLYQQVRLEREKLSSITLNIGEGVCAVDADGKLGFVNRAAADMIELSSAGITIDDPMSDSALTAPDFLLAPAREAMRTGRTIRNSMPGSGARTAGRSRSTWRLPRPGASVPPSNSPSCCATAMRWWPACQSASPCPSQVKAPMTSFATRMWRCTTIVRAVIDVANAMGISTVAEGVETEGQLAELRTLGSPVAQGFYFSEPLRAAEFDELLARHFARARPGVAAGEGPPGPHSLVTGTGTPRGTPSSRS